MCTLERPITLHAERRRTPRAVYKYMWLSLRLSVHVVWFILSIFQQSAQQQQKQKQLQLLALVFVFIPGRLSWLLSFK